ncbi:hypothetical protein BJ912DRAFT_934136 [Pholiota molesta]|nr:hypothetical protein BJ912DRAFT_934136 [Pholiota molesta]
MNDNIFGALSSPAFGTQLEGENSMPMTSSSFPHPNFPYFSQNTPITPSFSGSDRGVGIARMKLSDLFVNQHVENLFNKWTDANNKAERYIEEQHRLLQQVNSLQNTVFELRTELATVQTKIQGTTNVHWNNVPSAATTIQPFVGTAKPNGRRISRPEGLPHSVLWLADDVRQYEGLTSESNKSRPKMELCICQSDGSVITGVEYSALQALIRRFVAFELTPLSTPKNPAAGSTQRTRRWYRKWYPQNYQEVLRRLEEADKGAPGSELSISGWLVGWSQ